nr:methylmalonyl-CoA epimerase, mitochondrial isoform X3 [Microcebus murinus]
MAYVQKAAALAAGLFSRLQSPVPTLRAFFTSQPLHQVADPVWNLGRLNHVAIAVPDLEKAATFYKNVLGARVSEAVPLPEHGVSVVFVNLGNTKIELLHPLGSDSPIAGFLQKNKTGGMHHICIEEVTFGCRSLSVELIKGFSNSPPPTPRMRTFESTLLSHTALSVLHQESLCLQRKPAM